MRATSRTNITLVLLVLGGCAGRREVTGRDEQAQAAPGPSVLASHLTGCASGPSADEAPIDDLGPRCGGRVMDDGGCGPPDGMPCLLGCDERRGELDEDPYALRRGTVLNRDAASAALSRVDLSCCAVGGHGHVTITLEPSGRVGVVTVDARQPSNDRVRQCVVEQYSKMKVPAFRGLHVKIGHSF